MNHGVLIGQRPSDWIAGTIPHEVRKPDGNWLSELPPGEWQADHGVDTMACVTFSNLNTIEAQMKLYGTSLNLSDRFTAKMSGTTNQGNYLYKVADSVRNHGVVPEYQWPVPQNYTWDQYYMEIPPMPVMRLNVRYEFLLDTSKDALMFHLKHAPLQVVIPGHAVMLFKSEAQVDKYFDSYSPFKKDWTSGFTQVMKQVYYDTVEPIPMTSKQVRQLQALEGYHDEAGIVYWTGKTLEAYLAARLPDKKQEIEQSLA